ncbi:MAG TPA: hypothetical protein VGQ16_14480 [Vicinamibacterales bacterium]|jgi:hypothetical protein|nr:hypothetical protein [Vicinamibacterales bacterium]
MPSELDTSNWSGEGTFTQILIDRLRELDAIVLIRVEDAPATRSDADYNFISNEVFVEFATRNRQERSVRFGFLPATRTVTEKMLDVAGLEQALTAMADVGGPDYADEGMMQYLRTERIVPPYQTRGYKLVELVRIYEVGTPRRS